MTGVDFGWWVDQWGRRGLLTWHRDTGQLLYATPNGRPELIALVSQEGWLRSRLDGWQDQLSNGHIDWVRDRFCHPECPTCHGERWVQSNYDDGEVTVACWCVMAGGAP